MFFGDILRVFGEFYFALGRITFVFTDSPLSLENDLLEIGDREPSCFGDLSDMALFLRV